MKCIICYCSCLWREGICLWREGVLLYYWWARNRGGGPVWWVAAGYLRGMSESACLGVCTQTSPQSLTATPTCRLQPAELQSINNANNCRNTDLS